MRLSTIMTSNPLVLTPEDTLERAEAVMRVAHARHWPVARERALVGVVSLRDLLEVQRPDAPEERLEHWVRLKTGHVMTQARVVAHPDDDLLHAAVQMHRHRLSCLPVIEHQRLVGLVTLDHMVEQAVALIEEAERDTGRTQTVAQVMTADPLATVQVLERIDEAQSTMRQYGVRHLPVLNGDRLIGVLSEGDILDVLRNSLEDASGIVVGEVMTQAPETTIPEAAAADAARELMHKQIGVLPVLSQRRLVGVLAKSDFLRYIIDAASPYLSAEPS
jgi:CBS domain-containing protein